MMQLTTRLEPVLDVNEVVALEQRLDASGTSLAELMDRAGGALAARIEQQLPAPAQVLVLAGSGNNGGDGWVAARLLADAGYAVSLVTKRPASDIRAHPAHEAALRATQASIDVRVSPGADELAKLFAQADAVIDAILGTGFAGETVREPYRAWIGAANEARRAREIFALAADVPSGLSAQDGTQAAPTFCADCTVTMLAAKPGLLVPGANAVTGEVLLAPLV
ncbi:MAG: NAD(P)H-hydrate epimerase [Coriobacteriales bacterium]